jgi:hypothetical protein
MDSGVIDGVGTDTNFSWQFFDINVLHKSYKWHYQKHVNIGIEDVCCITHKKY